MQRIDPNLQDDPFFEREEDKNKIHSKAVPRRHFTHKIKRRGLAASSLENIRTVLTPDQLLQCADSYTNNGIVRSIVDRTVFMIQGERTNFVIEPNDKFTDSVTDEEAQQLEQEIADDTWKACTNQGAAPEDNSLQ